MRFQRKEREKAKFSLLFLDEKKQKSSDCTEFWLKSFVNAKNVSIPPKPLKHFFVR